jgi:chromosome partition protein MukF
VVRECAPFVTVTDSPSSQHGLLETLRERGPALDLSTLEICFLVALQRRAEERGLPAFGEQELSDVFEQVSSVVSPELEQVRARATHAIRRLREQRLLVRVDGAGVRRAGDFGLSRLASAITDFFVDEEALSRDDLDLLARTLLASLREVLAAAQRAKRPEEWRGQVIGPLRITASDLILGIERRQRGFDARQESFQREITRLLEAEWWSAMGRCQTLLDDSAATLQQLGELLLRYTHELQSVLHDLLELSVACEQREAEGVTERLMGQVDRIAAWGAARQTAWSDYYDHVHRYLRDVVRLDPSRALTARLREQLSGHGQSSFALTVAAAPALRVLRDVVPPAPPAPVRRPRPERAAALEQVAPPAAVDPLEARVQELIAGGARQLSDVTRQVTAELPDEHRFLGAGKIAELAARLGRPEPERERPWVPVGPGLVIEDWPMTRGERRS